MKALGQLAHAHAAYLYTGKHTISLAQRLRSGLVERGFRVLTPPNNASSIVSFVHGGDPDVVRGIMEENGIQLSFREDGTQIRVGIALFNNAAEIDRFLQVTERLS